MPIRTLLLGCLFVSAVHAEDWPEFRGPGAQGVSQAKGVPIKWSPTENVVWKQALPGSGWSSPVVIGDRIFLTAAVPQPDADKMTPLSLRTLALDAKKGTVIWDEEVFKQGEGTPKIHKKNSHASPTPIWEAGKLYVHFGHEGTACLDADTGSILWKNRDNRYEPVHGNGSSPVLVDDVLVYTADGREKPGVVALDKATGVRKWRYDRVAVPGGAPQKFAFSTPLVIEVAGKKQIVSTGANVLSALDPKDGKEIWRFNFSGYSVVPRPVFAQGLVIFSTGYNSPSAIAVKANGKGDVTKTHQAWKIDKNAPHNPSMIVVGNEMYMVADSGLLSCVDVKSGEVIYKERATGGISASILYADGKLYLQDEAGKGAVVKAGRTFELLASNDLGEKSLASYGVVGSDLLIRTEKHLWRIGAK